MPYSKNLWQRLLQSFLFITCKNQKEYSLSSILKLKQQQNFNTKSMKINFFRLRVVCYAISVFSCYVVIGRFWFRRLLHGTPLTWELVQMIALPIVSLKDFLRVLLAKYQYINHRDALVYSFWITPSLSWLQVEAMTSKLELLSHNNMVVLKYLWQKDLIYIVV